MEYLSENRQKKYYLNSPKKTLGGIISNAIERIDSSLGLTYAPRKKPSQLSVPSETWDLHSGLVEVYPINKQETLYIINNPGTRTLTGVLRHEVKSINKSAERFSELFPKVLPGHPNSIDGIANALIKSKDEVRKSESGKMQMMFDYTKHEVSANQMQVAKYLGWYDPDKILKIGATSILTGWVLEALAGIIGGAVLLEPKFGNYLSGALTGGILSTIFGMLPTLMFGGLSTGLLSNYFDKTRITKNVNALKSKIRKQQKIANKIKQKFKTAKTFDSSVEASNEIKNQNALLHKYWAVLHEVITHNCASITYSQQYEPGSKDCASEEDAKNKVLEFFREKVISEKKDIAPEKVVDAYEENLVPVPTLDKIIIKQNWVKDEQYGREIDGRYVLQEMIGEGGLCRVYRAVRKLDDKEVAIKFEKPEASALREKEELIKTLKTVCHENLIETHDANLQANPAYIVMDLIEGADLGRVLDFARATKQYLSLENIMCIARQTGEALKALHSNGTHKKVVHNDIKPQNILIDKNGKTYLGDCDVADIAKDINSMLSQATAEKASGAGTLEYMSPERRSAEKTKINEKSDIYSFGVVLYEMLAGQVPMTPDGLDRRTDLPEDLRKLVCKCVALNPEDRYGSMGEVIDELNKLQIKSKPAKLITKYEIKEEQPKKEAEQQPLSANFVAKANMLLDKIDGHLNEIYAKIPDGTRRLEEIRRAAETEQTEAPKQEDVKAPEPPKEAAPEIIKEPEHVKEPAAEAIIEPEPEDEEEPEEEKMYE